MSPKYTFFYLVSDNSNKENHFYFIPKFLLKTLYFMNKYETPGDKFANDAVWHTIASEVLFFGPKTRDEAVCFKNFMLSLSCLNN